MLSTVISKRFLFLIRLVDLDFGQMSSIVEENVYVMVFFIQNEIVVHAPKTSVNKSLEDSSENEIPSDKVEKKPIARSNVISSERALNHLVPGVYDMHDMENEAVSIKKSITIHGSFLNHWWINLKKEH